MAERSATILAILFLIGSIAGLGLNTFIYAKGAAYLTNDPKACANCHVMNNHYNSWAKSSHRTIAVCNDCHTPKGLIPKYVTKALNGWNHSVAFTTGDFAEPFHMTERNRKITETSCRKCHADIVHQIDTKLFGEPMSCVRCHSTVGHME